jgi:uncharacterized protein (TIGR03000 family)
MTKQRLSAVLVGVLGLLLHPGISSAQVRSPAVTGISAGTNYYPYRGYGGSYYFARPYAPPMYYYARPYFPAPAVAAMPDLGSRALLDVRVPADAEVFVEGDKTSQTGSDRTFVSPALEPGRTFTYDIRARWAGPDGKPIEQTRQVKVQGGRRTPVDFLDGSSGGRPAPTARD